MSASLHELVGDLLRGADQRIAAMAGDEVCLVRIERLGVVRCRLQSEDAQEISRSLPIALLMDVMVQVVLGLLLGLAASRVDVDPQCEFPSRLNGPSP